MTQEHLTKTQQVSQNLVFRYDTALFAAAIEKAQKFLQIPSDAHVTIWEGWKDITEDWGVTHPFDRMYNLEEQLVAKEELDTVWDKIVEPNKERLKCDPTAYVEISEENKARPNRYVIRIAQKAKAPPIKLLAILFHETRHVQQQCFRSDICVKMQKIRQNIENTTNKTDDYIDTPFETDAIVYSRERLRAAGFPESEIVSLFKEMYPTHHQQLMTAQLTDLEAVIREIDHEYETLLGPSHQPKH